jgi:hypothetical protein
MTNGAFYAGATVISCVVIATSIWVAIDSCKLGAGRGRRFLELAPLSWFCACLLFWIAIFPYYLIERRRVLAARVPQAPITPPWPSALTAGVEPSEDIAARERPTLTPRSNAPVSLSAELERLYQLHQSGALSADEYATLKQRAIAR